MPKYREMFPLWTKLILFPLTILCLTYTAIREFDLSPSHAHDVTGNNSIAASYQGCFPVLKTHPSDCKKLFYCIASNGSKLIPIIYPVKFSLTGDCKAVLNDKQGQQVSAEMKVFIEPSQKTPQSGFILKDEGDIYIAQWKGDPTSVDMLRTYEKFSIYIFLARACSVGTIMALPTYSMYIKCKIDKGPHSYFVNFCTDQVGIAKQKKKQKKKKRRGN